MGSDNGIPRPQCRFLLQRHGRTVVFTTCCFFLFAFILNKLLPPPETVLSEAFSVIPDILPSRCMALAKRFHTCQQSRNYTRIFCCHRKWCQSYGYCIPCAGVGDRSHRLLQAVQDAVNDCVRVQIDHPTTGMAVLKSAVYTDPLGWLGEVLHKRSYDVSKRHRLDRTAREAFAHFDHHGRAHPPQDFDPCLWHVLFQPGKDLKKQLDYHNAAIGSPSIGIHFRTGDEYLQIENKDVRVKGSLSAATDKMLQCADRLAQKLFPNQQVTFFFATDNAKVKERLMRSTDKQVYLTDVLPQNFFAGNSGDIAALLELYLLSHRQGLVMNVNKNNMVIGERRSTFVQLAQKIGFVPESHVAECELD